MNDTSSAWHCNACSRLHVLGVPVSRPERCEDCGARGLSDAGPTSGFGDLNLAAAQAVELEPSVQASKAATRGR